MLVSSAQHRVPFSQRRSYDLTVVIRRRSMALLLLATLLGAPPTASVNAARTRVSCAPHRVLIARGFGAPDDLAVQRNRILFTDEPKGILGAISSGRVRVLARGLAGPEGIVVWPKNQALVAEQDLNRIVTINLNTGSRHVFLRLRNNTDNLGLDGLGPAPHGSVYVPDSPNRRLLLMDRKARLRVLVTGLGRPVGAASYAGGIAIADETANAVWLFKAGHLTRLATLSIPDDVAVLNGKLLAVTLGDKALWEVYPRRRLLAAGFGDPQGLAIFHGNTVIVADSKANSIYRMSGLMPCL